MLIRVMDVDVLVEPGGHSLLGNHPYEFTDEEIRESAIFGMAADAARTGQVQILYPIAVHPPNIDGVCDVYIDGVQCVVDHDADEPYFV